MRRAQPAQHRLALTLALAAGCGGSNGTTGTTSEALAKGNAHPSGAAYTTDRRDGA